MVTERSISLFEWRSLGKRATELLNFLLPGRLSAAVWGASWRSLPVMPVLLHMRFRRRRCRRAPLSRRCFSSEQWFAQGFEVSFLPKVGSPPIGLPTGLAHCVQRAGDRKTTARRTIGCLRGSHLTPEGITEHRVDHIAAGWHKSNRIHGKIHPGVAVLFGELLVLQRFSGLEARLSVSHSDPHKSTTTSGDSRAFTLLQSRRIIS